MKYTYTPRNINPRTPNIYVLCNIKHKKDTRDLHTTNQDTKALHTFQHQDIRDLHIVQRLDTSDLHDVQHHDTEIYMIRIQDTRALHNIQLRILDIYATLKIRMPQNAHCAIQMLETCTLFSIKIPKTSGSGMSEIPVCGECLRTAKIQTDTRNRRVRTAETQQHEGWRWTLEIQKDVCKWRWGVGER